MRCWHKDLLTVLPRQQLLSQWRECCCIARNITVNGTPNHILVNKIMDYDIKHFQKYTYLVYQEMKNRGYKVNKECFNKYYPFYIWLNKNDLFKDWHNDKYLRQCYYNLEEKYYCGGIIDKEWVLIFNKYNELTRK